MDPNHPSKIGRIAPDFHCGEALACGSRQLHLTPPAVMGILNITPDSFSDGGELYDISGPRMDVVLRRAESMLAAGASLLDIGGESTRPGAAPVSSAQEIDRVAPVVEALAERFDTIISIDSSNPELIARAADLGAGMINDVRALQRPGALQAAAAAGLPVCLMHMQGEPATMQQEPHYHDVAADVLHYLQQRIEECVVAGIPRECIVIDPGFGFGKSLAHNLQLFRHLPALAHTGFPLLVGVSRKSMIAAVTGRESGQRVAGGLALAALAVEHGAAILRVHDVEETQDVVAMIDAVLKAEQ